MYGPEEDRSHALNTTGSKSQRIRSRGSVSERVSRTGNNFSGRVLVQIWITKADPRVERVFSSWGPFCSLQDKRPCLETFLVVTTR